MKKLYRRSISGLMALLICFTTILGGGITAFAASSSGEVAKILFHWFSSKRGCQPRLQRHLGA